MIISFSDQLLGLPFLIKQARFLQDLFIPNIRIFQDISIAMRDKILGEWTSFWFGLVQIRRKPLKKITFEENEVGDSNCTLFIQNICMNELINDEEVS